MTVHEARSRAKDFHDSVRHIDYADERTEIERCVHDLILCSCEAKEQGDPNNPEVAKQVARERKSISMMMPQSLPHSPGNRIHVPGIGNGVVIQPSPQREWKI